MNKFDLNLDGGGYFHKNEWDNIKQLNDYIQSLDCFIVPKGKDKIIDYHIFTLISRNKAYRIGELEYEDSSFSTWYDKWPSGQKITLQEYEEYISKFNLNTLEQSRAKSFVNKNRSNWKNLSFLGRKEKFSKEENILHTDIKMPKIYIKTNVLGTDCYFMSMDKIYKEGEQKIRYFKNHEDLTFNFDKEKFSNYIGWDNLKKYFLNKFGIARSDLLRSLNKKNNFKVLF